MALERKHVVMVQNETAYGEDVLGSLSEDARKMFALEAEDQSLEIEFDSEDREPSGSTLSQLRADLVGVGTAPAQFRVDFRGMGSPSTDPEWWRALLSCGFQSESGFKMTYNNLSVGNEFQPGTQISGPNTTADTAADWQSTAAGGASADNQPAVDDAVIAYNGSGGNPDKPRVRGTIVALSGTTVLIRHRGDSAGSIKSGDVLRATTAPEIAAQIDSITPDATTEITMPASMGREVASTFEVTIQGSETSSGPNINGTHTATVTGAATFTIPVDTSTSTFTVDGYASADPEFAYTTVNEDQPIGIVMHSDTDNATLYGWLRQGVFQEGDAFVAQQVGTTADVVSMFNHGRVARPVSNPVIQFATSSWTGSTPSPGTELLIYQAGGLGPAKAACKVISYNAASNLVTAVLPEFGKVENSDSVLDALGGGVASATTDQAITQMPSATIYSTKDGQRKIGTGGYGNLQIELTAGQPGRVTMAFQLKAYSIGAPVVHPTDIGVDLTNPPRWQGGSAKIAGLALRTLRMGLDMQNDLQRLSDANASEGFAGFRIVGRSPQLTFSVARPEISAFHAETRMRNASWVTAAATVGSSEGNMMVLCAPRVQIKTSPSGDDNGNTTVEGTCKCLGIVGDDEVLIGSF